MAEMYSKLKRRIMTWLIILMSLYVIYCGLLFFFQTKLIFPADFAGERAGPLPTVDTLEIRLKTDQGTTLAWFAPAPDASADAPAPLVVFCHGNAELIDQQDDMVLRYNNLGVSVLLVEFRGYGDSEGTPSEKHLVADTLAVLGDVLARGDVDAKQLIIHGRSIGGGVAAQVALQSKPAAVIVESTGASVASMAWRYGAPSFLVRSPFRTAEAFKQLDIPILIMHGKHDQIFPLHHANQLEQAGEQTTLVLFDAGHNTLPSGQEFALYEQSIREHLQRADVLR